MSSIINCSAQSAGVDINQKISNKAVASCWKPQWVLAFDLLMHAKRRQWSRQKRALVIEDHF
jgi:hypothetical protein